jgi:hypothetical protein
VRSLSSGDEETVTLTETVNASGVFRNTVGLPTATAGAVAGNGILEGHGLETIQAAYIDNEDAADSISFDIQSEAQCGDGFLDPGEDCDDGNAVDGDCCSAVCTAETIGNACATDNNECTQDACDGLGSCLHTNLADGTACTDDGVFCTGTETCQSGSCTSGGNPCSGLECNTCQEDTDKCIEPLGTACTADGNECSDDYCDGAGSCVHPGNSAPCDDGLFCNGTDTCGGGSCSAHSGSVCPAVECGDVCDEATDTCNQPQGVPCTDDGNECTDDQCDGLGACVHDNLAFGTACTDDGNQCTTNICDGYGLCQALDNSDACDDGDLCTENDSCSGGLCSGTPVPGCGSTTTTTTTLPPIPVCGDPAPPPNGDGQITPVDALVALRTAVGFAPLCQLSHCDVNNDGAVTAVDALQVLRYAVGVNVLLDCGGTTTTSTTTSPAPTTSSTTSTTLP